MLKGDRRTFGDGLWLWIIVQRNIAALKRKGQEPDTQELEELRQKVTQAYETTTDIRYGAARGWVDGIIEPANTRETVIRCLELSTRHASDEPFRTGVLQV